MINLQCRNRPGFCFSNTVLHSKRLEQIIYCIMYSASSLVCVVSFSSFNQSPGTYVVNEGSGSVQPVLSLSYLSSINITVQVSTTNGSATGEH